LDRPEERLLERDAERPPLPRELLRLARLLGLVVLAGLVVAAPGAGLGGSRDVERLRVVPVDLDRLRDADLDWPRDEPDLERLRPRGFSPGLRGDALWLRERPLTAGFLGGPLLRLRDRDADPPWLRERALSALRFWLEVSFFPSRVTAAPRLLSVAVPLTGFLLALRERVDLVAPLEPRLRLDERERDVLGLLPLLRLDERERAGFLDLLRERERDRAGFFLGLLRERERRGFFFLAFAADKIGTAESTPRSSSWARMRRASSLSATGVRMRCMVSPVTASKRAPLSAACDGTARARDGTVGSAASASDARLTV